MPTLRPASRVVLWLTIVTVLLPVCADFLFSDRDVSFRYLAPDSFYYNTVARHIAERGAISFDGTHPTSGFHPLWQAMLAALYWLSMVLGWPLPWST